MPRLYSAVNLSVRCVEFRLFVNCSWIKTQNNQPWLGRSKLHSKLWLLICNIRFQEVYTHTSLDSTNIQMVLRVALWIRHCRLFICIMLTHGENKLDPSGDDFKRNISQVRLVGREARVCILQINNPHFTKIYLLKEFFLFQDWSFSLNCLQGYASHLAEALYRYEL